MIKAIHTLIYSDDPLATRAFLRDVLEWPYVEDPNSAPGWLMFEDMGFGIGAMLKLPGAGDILLYQPKHPEAHSL